MCAKVPPQEDTTPCAVHRYTGAWVVWLVRLSHLHTLSSLSALVSCSQPISAVAIRASPSLAEKTVV